MLGLLLIPIVNAFVFYEYMGTKTPYLHFTDTMDTIETIEPNANGKHGQNGKGQCQLRQVQLLSRHGTRYPTQDSLVDYDILANYLNQFPFLGYPLNQFTNPFDYKTQGELHPKGILNMQWMAQRFNASYSLLLRDPRRVFIQASNKNRAVDSAIAFYKELYPYVDHVPLTLIDPKRDADLRPFDTCPIQEGLKDVSKANEFINLYFPKLAAEWSLKWNVSLDAQDILILMEYCVFNITLLPNQKQKDSQFYTPICLLFDEYQMNLYQLYSDLKTFYTFGYGNAMNSKMMCSLFTGITNGMKSVISNTDLTTPLVYLRFAHAETLMPFMTLLGLFNESTPLDPYAPFEKLEKRRWKTWKVSPFSVNIIFELYSCDDELELLDQSVYSNLGVSQEKEYRIVLRLNEKIVPIPDCPYPCVLSDFLNAYKEYLSCPFDDICGSVLPSIGSWRD